jgi:hypothetical protein
VKTLRRLLAFVAVVVLIIVVFHRPLDRWNDRRIADTLDSHYFLIESYSGGNLYTMRHGGNIYTVKCGPNFDSIDKDWPLFRGTVQLECDEIRLFMGQILIGTVDVTDHEGQIKLDLQKDITFTIESMRPVD